MMFFISTAEHFFYFLCMMLLTLMFYVAYGQALMYVCSSVAMAMILGIGTTFIFGLFNGYVIAYSSIPVYWRWLNRLSPNTWMVSLLRNPT